MHPLLRTPYAALGQLARTVGATIPAGDSKLVQTFRSRRDIRGRYADWGMAGRAADRPLLWVHAPSVGEGLQATPVIQIVRAEYPKAQVAYTHFSPSAAVFAANIGADFHDFLPFDTIDDGEAALDALRPSALVFAKLDVWPTLVERATRRGVKTGVISATLAPMSRRRSALGRALLGDAYAQLDAVGAIAQEDADRLIELGVRPHVIRVTGDTRYDQVWERTLGVDPESALLRPLASDRPLIVGGSTWPADEQVLLAAYEEARASEPSLRLLIAPHEPTRAHVEAIERWALSRRIAAARLATVGVGEADIVIVDRVGVLGDLYALADIAFVGGGFHDAGLHSVLEPAAFGAPVIFGPRTGGARDAERLVTLGGAFVFGSAPPMTARILEWIANPALRMAAGARARAMVADGLGAARATYDMVRTLLPD